MKRKYFIALLVVLFLVNVGFARDLRKNGFLVDEPVFDSKAYLYESGKKHDITVVLVHGVGSEGIKTWDHTVATLEKKFHVLTFDLPGFGRSTSRNGLYSPLNYAKFVNWVIKMYAKKEVYLMGHSMGGAISLCYAGTYPDSIKRLILVDAAGIIHRVVFSKNTTAISTKGMAGYFAKALRKVNSITSSTIETIDAKFMPAKVGWMLKSSFVRKRMLGGNTQAIAAMALINTDLSKQIDAVSVPTLLVWGEKDNIAPVRTGKMLSVNIKQAELKIMKKLGHSPMLEAPNDFNAIIYNWLRADVTEKKKPEHKTGSDEKLILKNKSGITIRNRSFSEIKLVNCTGVRLENVIAGKIYIKNSTVTIEKSIIKSGNVAVISNNSTVIMTGCYIKAQKGIVTSYSRLDLAGVKIVTEKQAIVSKGLSTVVFSVSSIKSSKNNKHFHAIKKLSKNDSL